MGEITYHCDLCPKIDLERGACSAFANTSWVDRLGGCCINKVGAEITVKTVGQQKQGRRKMVGAVDLTQGGLFLESNGTGVGWKSNVELSNKVANRTPGRDKPFGKATPFARYCATYSRAYKHRDYHIQEVKWAKANR